VTSVERVTLEAVSKSFGRQRALNGVDLELKAGRLCAVLGPNGAGKSTLIGVLSTLVRPTAGAVAYHAGGATLSGRHARAAVGLLAHESFLYGELDALENLRLYGALYDVPDLPRRATEVLDEVGLEQEARSRPARTYSRGMLQRLALARAVLHHPSVLYLDEPFTGLDRQGVDALARVLGSARAERRVVLVVTHDLEAIGGLVDHLVVLRRGKIVHDELAPGPIAAPELKARYASLLG
jgi:heme exporter protein A